MATKPTLTSVTFEDNRASYQGGALYTGPVDIRESTFIGNEASQGHQIWATSGGITIVNTHFTHTKQTSLFGGPSPTTCSADATLCSVEPFTGACTDLGNEGVTCGLPV